MDGATKKFNAIALSSKLILLGTMIVFCSGCVGTAAQMLYFIKGDKEKAAFPGLKEKRVVILCESDATSYGPNPLTETMSAILSMQIQQNVKKVVVVPQQEIDSWKDQNGWNAIDPVELGKDLDADMVLAVDLSGYSIHEGSTMFKGRSTIKTTVYDIEDDGSVVFVHGPELFEFPKSHARPAIGTSESEFERAYITKITQQLSVLFYDHERLDNFAQDAWMYD